MERTEQTLEKCVSQYYNDYVLTKTKDYFPPEYKQYFDKYDNDILQTHCGSIVDHHLDISKYLMDIADCHQALNDKIEEKDAINKSFVRRFFNKIKKGFLTFILSELLFALYFAFVLSAFSLRAIFVDNNFSFFVGLSLFVATLNIYKIIRMFVEIKIKKTKSFSQFSLYRPKDKINDLTELSNIIYDKFFNYLKTNNTIPERKLIEVMRKNPCMYNDNTFFGLYLMSKQIISIFDSAEEVENSCAMKQNSNIICKEIF